MAIWDIKEIYKKVRSNEIKGTRGFFSGGEDPGGTSAAIDMINFVSDGNAVDFGDITIATNQLGGGNAGSTTRGFVRFGGENASGYYETPCEVINTRGGTGAISQDFGTLTVGSSGKGVFSSQIRAVSGGGAITPAGNPQNVIDYFTIATYGNATDFGDLTVARSSSDGLASPTRGIFAGGFVSPNTIKNEIDYITIASTGDAADFGDLDVTRRHSGTGTNRTRGIIAGGQVPGTTTQMDYITIATTGNSTDFGDLTAARQSQGVSNSIDIIFGGGSTTNILDKMTIANLANTVDFGDLTKNFNVHLAASDGHGGLTEEHSINLQRPSVTYMPGSGRGFMAGGNAPSIVNTIDICFIPTDGNFLNFGDLTATVANLSGLSSLTRGFINGGWTGSANVDTVQSIEMAAQGNAADFGNLTSARRRTASCSSTTRGITMGGLTPGRSNIIDFITMATAGNSTDFGDLLAQTGDHAGCASSTRGVSGGGSAPGNINVIQYITISSTGNSTDFGDLTEARRYLSGCSSSTRGVFWCGNQPEASSVIDYITIASTGNATDFGDPAVTPGVDSIGAGLSNNIRGVFGGRATPDRATVEKITIATTGNATDFGDLSQGRSTPAGASDFHGGLQA